MADQELVSINLGAGAPMIWLPPGAAAQAGNALGRPANPRPGEQTLNTPQSYRDANGVPVTPGDPRREYVARSNRSVWRDYKNYLAALPRATDDLDRELGTDVVRAMLRDPQINSSIYLIALACLSRGIQVKPRITDIKDPAYQMSLKMQRFIEYNLAQLENSFTDTLLDMIVGAMSVGNSAAEQTWHLKERGEWSGNLLLGSIKVKPPEVYAFLMDRYGNVPALAAYTGSGDFRHPFNATPLFITGNFNAKGFSIEMPFEALGSGWEAIPIEKFAVMSYRKRYGDPRGQSALRAAFGSWYLLMQLWPEYLKYLTQFASPSIVGTTPEKAVSVYNKETGELEDPLDVLYTELLNFANGTVLALKYGSEVDLKWSQGDGVALISAINMLNQQMVKSILHQLLATEEGKHQARAASSTHQDVLNIAVRGVKNMVVSMVQRQILRPLIRMNFGDNAAELLTPWCSLGDIAQEDKSDMIKAYGAAGYKLGYTQFPAIDAELEVEVRSVEQAEKDFEAANLSNKAEDTANPKVAKKPNTPTKAKPNTASALRLGIDTLKSRWFKNESNENEDEEEEAALAA